MLYGSGIVLLFYLEIILSMTNKSVCKCQVDNGELYWNYIVSI